VSRRSHCYQNDDDMTAAAVVVVVVVVVSSALTCGKDCDRHVSSAVQRNGIHRDQIGRA